MNDSLIASLLQDLKNSDATIREQATQELWQIWFEQKGVLGVEIIRQAQIALEAGNVAEAEKVLTELITNQPDFAEAWNRRAVLYYTEGRYRQAIGDCEAVIRLNPVHFGALHGLGLCYAALGDYRMAIGFFQQALEIQPHAAINQRLILECTIRMS